MELKGEFITSIEAMKTAMEWNGFTITSVVPETYEADAEIDTSEGISVSFSEDGFVILKKLPNGNYKTYPITKNPKTALKTIVGARNN